MSATHTTLRTGTVSRAHRCPPLPEWPVRTIAVLTTLGGDGPHAIPVSAPVRAGDHRILINLHRSRDSLERLRARSRAAITILAAGNVAFTARGETRVVQERMSAGPEYAAIALDVDEVDDHRQPGFEVAAGADRRWLDDDERAALGERVGELTAAAPRAEH